MSVMIGPGFGSKVVKVHAESPSELLGAMVEQVAALRHW